MKFHFGVLLLVVALAMAIDQANSEESNVEMKVRREADPGIKKEILGYLSRKLKKLLPAKRSADPRPPPKKMAELRKLRQGRNADPAKVSVAQILKMITANKKGKRNAAPNPSILDVITDLVNKAMDATG